MEMVYRDRNFVFKSVKRYDQGDVNGFVRE